MALGTWQQIVVVDFDNIMPPDYGDSLTEGEVGDLVEYIKSLAG